MFEILGDIAQARAQIEHLAEATGLSIGLIAALVALAVLDPAVRSFAVRAAILVLLLYGAFIGGNRVRADDDGTYWQAQIAEAAKARDARDTSVAVTLAADNPAPTPAQLQQEQKDEASALAAVSAAAAVPCRLGPDALRLRH